jgi:hypothetical protein
MVGFELEQGEVADRRITTKRVGSQKMVNRQNIRRGGKKE